ncbi:hypothetical protein J6A31_00290 [bacterium]|nr:hypothetical protein [bacterium]
MQIQNLQNNQTFKGRVAIIGELSALPCKHVRRISPELKNLVKDKHFDLFIKEDYERNVIEFSAQKPTDFGKNNKPISKYELSRKLNYYNDDVADEIYLATAKSTVNFYEKTFPQTESKVDKFKNFVKKLFKN